MPRGLGESLFKYLKNLEIPKGGETNPEVERGNLKLMTGVVWKMEGVCWKGQIVKREGILVPLGGFGWILVNFIGETVKKAGIL